MPRLSLLYTLSLLLVISSCKKDDCGGSSDKGFQAINPMSLDFLPESYKNSPQDLLFVNETGQSLLFMAEPFVTDFTFSNAFVECDRSFAQFDYRLEFTENEFSSNNYRFEVGLAKRLGLDNFSGQFIPGQDTCLTDALNIRFFDFNSGESTFLQIETIQGSCFNSLSFDNFKFNEFVFLNGKAYENVYSTAFDLQVFNFYYTKEKGLIGFRDPNGVTWNLFE